MRLSTAFASASCATLATAGIMLGGCSASHFLGANAPVPRAAALQRQALGDRPDSLAARLGAAPGSQIVVGNAVSRPDAGTDRSPFAGQTKGLFVTDLYVRFHVSGVKILSPKKYKEVGTLTGSFNAPDGDFIDHKGNLYVADANLRSILEFAPNASSPTCTYTGLADPTGVTVDDDGTVFGVDWNLGSTGTVDVYRQCKDTIVRQYAAFNGGAPADVALDAAGNMFVLYYTGSAGALEEFKAGSMQPTPLGATFIFPGGLAIDSKENLIVADQGTAGKPTGSINIVPPPYKSATPIITHLVQPFHESLSKDEKLLFVDSFPLYRKKPAVWVVDYPKRTIQKRLGVANQLVSPLGVAASPDAVF